MADIIDMTGRVAKADTDPDETLKALSGTLQAFVLFGYDLDGNEVTAITFAQLPEALWAAKRGCKTILERVDAKD